MHQVRSSMEFGSSGSGIAHWNSGKTVSEDLGEFVITERTEDVLQVLANPLFSKSLTKNRAADGIYFFRIRDGKTPIGRSRGFKSRSERDEVYMRFVDWIETRIHNNFQRKLRFE